MSNDLLILVHIPYYAKHLLQAFGISSAAGGKLRSILQ